MFTIIVRNKILDVGVLMRAAFADQLDVVDVRRCISPRCPHLHREFKKVSHPNHGYNCVNSWSICKILSLLQRPINFQQDPILVYPPHLKYAAANYLVKLKNHLYGHMPGDIVDTAIDKWRKRLQAWVRGNGGHFEYLLWTNSCKQFVFSCFWFKWHLPMVSDVYCVDT